MAVLIVLLEVFSTSKNEWRRNDNTRQSNYSDDGDVKGQRLHTYTDIYLRN